MINRRHLITSAVVAVPFLSGVPLALAQDGTTQPLDDVFLGNPDAPVVVIEYASMTCPHCASFHNGTFKQLKEEYIDTGKVKFVMREFPFDPLAAAVSMLARCSGDNYFNTVDLFFENQRQWAVPEDPLGQIRGLALQAGFTSESFETCLTDQQLLDGLNAIKDHGYETMDVRSTPTLFIDGEKLEGSRDIRAFRERIDPKL